VQEYVIGVDLGGTTVKIGFFPRNEEVSETFEIPTIHGDADALFQSIADAILKKAEELSLNKNQIKAIGIDVPGPADEEGHVPRMVNVGLGSTYPAKEITKLTGIPAVVLNDANAATLGEVQYGAARGVRSAVLYTLGTGVGGGVVVDGKVVAGKHGIGGELGHMVVNPSETVACNCGNKGCLEQYASATGVVNTAKKILKKSDVPSSLRSAEEISAKMVMDAAKANDPVGLEALDTYARYMALAISYAILTVDPEIIILGGGMSKAGSILVDRINQYVNNYTHIGSKHADIVIAELSNDAGMYGAAAIAESIISE